MEPRSKRAALVLIVLLVGTAIVVLFSNLGGYPKVSESAYRIAMALNTACNQQQADKLDQIAELVTEAKSGGEVSEQEAAWLEEIIALGQKGEWKKASERVRRLLEDQVSRAD